MYEKVRYLYFGSGLSMGDFDLIGGGGGGGGGGGNNYYFSYSKLCFYTCLH